MCLWACSYLCLWVHWHVCVWSVRLRLRGGVPHDWHGEAGGDLRSAAELLYLASSLTRPGWLVDSSSTSSPLSGKQPNVGERRGGAPHSVVASARASRLCSAIKPIMAH